MLRLGVEMMMGRFSRFGCWVAVLVVVLYRCMAVAMLLLLCSVEYDDDTGSFGYRRWIEQWLSDSLVGDMGPSVGGTILID
jgi:hypothetical protein